MSHFCLWFFFHTFLIHLLPICFPFCLLFPLFTILFTYYLHFYSSILCHQQFMNLKLSLDQSIRLRSARYPENFISVVTVYRGWLPLSFGALNLILCATIKATVTWPKLISVPGNYVQSSRSSFGGLVFVLFLLYICIYFQWW